MTNTYSYDEKAAYEQRYHSRHNRSSYSSSNSSHHDDEKGTPPRYSYVFYNTIEEKPLPALPIEEDKERKVRFMVEKPLPEL